VQHQKLFRSAIVASLLVHVVGVVALATWSTTSSASRMRFAGREQVIQLTASLAEPHWTPEPVSFGAYDPPVVIQPTEARIARRRFIHSPRAELTLADLPDLPIEIERVFAFELPARAAPRDLSEPIMNESQASVTPLRQRHTTKPDINSSAAVALPSSAGTPRDTPPDLSQNAPPTYPSLAIQRGWEGTVTLRIWLDETGDVTKVQVARSSGYRILDGAAATAVRQWKAIPAREGDKPIATVELLPVRFRL
jgi:protein TonB